MSDTKEKTADAANTDGLTKRESLDSEIIPHNVEPIKKRTADASLLTDPQFLEVAEKFEKDEINAREGAGSLGISVSGFYRYCRKLHGSKVKNRGKRKAQESITAGPKVRKPREKRPKKLEPQMATPVQKRDVNLMPKFRYTKTCYYCQKEYIPSPTVYSEYKGHKLIYFCSWTCRCRFRRSIGKSI